MMGAFDYRLDGHGGWVSSDQAGPEMADADRWIHCNILDPESLDWFERESGVPEPAVAALTADSTRPRLMRFESGMVLILRGVNLNPGAEKEDMIAARMWLDEHRVITCQRRQLRSLKDTTDALDRNEGPTDCSEVVVAIIERLTEYIDVELDNADAELERTEDHLESSAAQETRAGLVALRRRIARLRRFLLPQRDALERLARDAEPWLTRDQVHDVHQAIDALTRHLEDLDLARERSLLIQDELLNRVSQQQNGRLYLLSIVTAVFLPLTFLTGLLGMNVGGLPGLEDPIAFWWVCGLSVGLAIGLGFLFRYLRWF